MDPLQVFLTLDSFLSNDSQHVLQLKIITQSLKKNLDNWLQIESCPQRSPI